MWNKQIQSLSHSMLLSSQVKLPLPWWLSNPALEKETSFLHSSWNIVTPYVSLTGRGGVYNLLTVQRTLFPKGANILKLRGIRLSLQHFTSFPQCHPGRVQSDNAKAVAYRNHQGGTKCLAVLKRNTLNTLMGRNSHCSSLGHPHSGSGQYQADFLSHQCLDLGGVVSKSSENQEVDILASRFNIKLNSDRLAAQVILWTQFQMVYTFPLKKILPNCCTE